MIGSMSDVCSPVPRLVTLIGASPLNDSGNMATPSLEEFLDEEGLDDDAALQDEEEGMDAPYHITSYGADYPVDGLVKRLRQGDIYIPEFQRGFVWSKPQASRFIESLLLGLPVPGIFLAKEAETERLMVVDGQQRLKTLQYFYEEDFQGRTFTLTGVDSDFKGDTCSDLTREERRRLDNSILHATIFKQDRPEEDDQSTYLIFERLNTGGTNLQPQEIRSCLYHGPFTSFLSDLNEYGPWREIYGRESKRMKDQELILRFLTLYFDLENYSKPMKGALNRFLKKNRDLTEYSSEALEEAFKPTIKVIHEALGDEAFRPTRSLNAAVFDSVTVGVARNLPEPVEDTDIRALEASYHRLLRDEDYQSAYKKSTSDGEQVRKRIQLAMEEFSGI